METIIIKMEFLGITSDRFVGDKFENFTCVICSEVIILPLMCGECEHLFCSNCIKEWLKKNDYCPFKCRGNNKMELKEIPKSIKKLYNSLKIRCSKASCTKILELGELLEHEYNCSNQKCCNSERCKSDAKIIIKSTITCSEKCYIVKMIE